jgi:hypothetical protein
MKKNYHFLILLLLTKPVLSQDFTGRWSGELIQEGKSTAYVYSLELVQQGNRVSGKAFSSQQGSKETAVFEVGGIWNGEALNLQEVQQLEPPKARWCLKHIRLYPILKNGVACLEGDWEAQGCTPGKMSLTNEAFPVSQLPIPTSRFVEDSPFTGKWTGYLSQSDRDYGFYFELSLDKDCTGTSQIISDGEGGNALHQLRWKLDEATGMLRFVETGILEKSVPAWRWCMKTAGLFFQQEENRLSLRGDWEGYIEGMTMENGACAPGKLYLEKPVIKKEEAAQKPVYQDYLTNQGRKVQAERVLEVRRKQVKIRVWDNGTVDGDVLSLFVNGELLLKNYRVTRNKYELFVTLDKPVNYLILHAINLGSISPNTVAVSVDDGTGEQVVIVSSNLDTSGAVMIREFTVKE